MVFNNSDYEKAFPRKVEEPVKVEEPPKVAEGPGDVLAPDEPDRGDSEGGAVGGD